MMLARLERQVVDALAHEQGTNTLARTIRKTLSDRFGGSPKYADMIDRRSDEALDFIVRYVGGTPDIVSAVVDAARQDGDFEVMLPILDAAEDYFIRSTNFIPDSLGLVGATDDAYMVQALLQILSDDHARRVGAALIPIGFDPANQLMRLMIGDPVAAAMDATVREVMGLREIQEARQRLEARTAPLHLRMPDPYAAGLCEPADMDLHLGAVGNAPVR